MSSPSDTVAFVTGSGDELTASRMPDLTRCEASAVPPPIAAFDRDERVITVGSLSKIGWGGLRIGWIRAPRADVDRIVAGKIVADHATTLITQAIAARLLERVDEVVAFTREAAAERRGIVTEALRAKLPDWEWEAPEGGLSLWVRLPDADAVQFSRLAARHGVIVRPGPGEQTQVRGAAHQHLLPRAVAEAVGLPLRHVAHAARALGQ